MNRHCFDREYSGRTAQRQRPRRRTARKKALLFGREYTAVRTQARGVSPVSAGGTAVAHPRLIPSPSSSPQPLMPVGRVACRGFYSRFSVGNLS